MAPMDRSFNAVAQKRKAHGNQSTLAALFYALPNTGGIPALAQFAYLQGVARTVSVILDRTELKAPGL